MNHSIYSFECYKDFLIQSINRNPGGGRGVRKQMAEAMGCQLAYVSHVLNGERHFGIEQAQALSEFLGLNQDESEYFVWMVEYARAGTEGAKSFFQNLLSQKKEKYLNLRGRIQISEDLTANTKAVYYSDYIYSAVHMLVTIESYTTVQSISDRLNETRKKVVHALEFLKTHGLVEFNGSVFRAASKYLFIEKGSPFLPQHHTNWRLQAIRSVREGRLEDVHLSLVVSVSKKDAAILKQKIAHFIEEFSQTVKSSPEEELMALNIDFFNV